MKRSSCLIVALSILVYSGFSFAFGTQGFLEKDFVLNPQQKQELIKQALDGSGQAALRLSRFYSNVTLDLDEALKWAIIGAENGDLNCEYTAYGFLDKRVSPDDRRRAQFWLKQAARQGYQPAIDHLKNKS
jgi:TPR repeat protein